MKFGVVLAVVIMGFASAFHALYRHDSFNETLLNLFMTMLGDVAFFDELEDSSREQYVAVGRLLLALFIIVVTIMLLNLLIAILSTAHADVHNNIKREFKVSTARTIQHYRLVVELDILPAPFNVLQSIMILPFTVTGRQEYDSCRRVKRAVGQVVFWITLGPIAVLAGVILWMASSLRIISILGKLGRYQMRVEVRRFCSILVPVLFAPLSLLVLWLKEPFMWIMRVIGFLCKESTPNTDQKAVDVNVQDILKDAGVSASELRKYLENPMIDPRVQRDEVNRATTVEHVKLLRDHLKDTVTALSVNTESRVSELHDKMKEKFAINEGRVLELRNEINDKFAINEGRVSELRDEIKDMFALIEGRVSELHDKMNEKMSELRDEVSAKFTTIIEMLEVNHNSILRKGVATGGN